MSRTLIALVALLILSTGISAYGIGVNPAKLEFEMHVDKSCSKTIYVINTADRRAGYRVYADDEIPYLSINPGNFQLDPGEFKDVNVTFSSHGIEESKYLTKISVVTINPSSRLGIGTGIKVPLSITVRGAGQTKDTQETKTATDEKRAESSTPSPPPLIGNVVAFAGSSNFLLTLIAILSLVLIALVPHVRSAWRRKRSQSPHRKKKGGLESLIIFFVLTLLVCGCIQVVEDNAHVVENKTLKSNIVSSTPSPKPGEIRIIVCTNFGREEILDTRYGLSNGDSAMHALQQVADVGTGYSGGFVNSINGIHSGYIRGRSTKMDWFYYINGILANTGPADYTLYEGDVQRWDYHDWSYQLLIPALVGDYPEPFVHGVEGDVLPTTIIYCGEEFRDDAGEIENSLVRLGVKNISIKSPDELDDSGMGNSNIILIGYPQDRLINELMEDHKKLGFFAYFEDNDIVILNPVGTGSKKTTGAVILATQNPWNPRGTGAFESVVWIITGTDEKEIEHGAYVLSEKHELLRNYFGVFVHDGRIIPLPCT